MIGGNDKHFNETSVSSTWSIFCSRLSLDCRALTKLGCGHFQLMSSSDACGYDAVKGILVQEAVGLITDGPEPTEVPMLS